MIVKCPVCVDAGLRSTVRTKHGGLRTLTIGGYEPFYDEDGHWHSHDPQWREASFICSNGHEFEQRSRGGCCEQDPYETTTRVLKEQASAG